MGAGPLWLPYLLNGLFLVPWGPPIFPLEPGALALGELTDRTPPTTAAPRAGFRALVEDSDEGRGRPSHRGPTGRATTAGSGQAAPGAIGGEDATTEAIPTTGRMSGVPPIDPWYSASPKVKMPPSEATIW